jgi:hypothetical protein
MNKDQTPQLIVHADQTVWRTCYCSCGKVIYKKCLTNDKIEILVSKGPGGYKTQNIINHNNPSLITISCPHCNMDHIIGNVSESLTLE